MISSLKMFITGALFVHLIFFSLIGFSVFYSKGQTKPSLNFLGAILAQDELRPKRVNDRGSSASSKLFIDWKDSGLLKNWQAKRDVEKPQYGNQGANLVKPHYKYKLKFTKEIKPPKKHATLEEIGVTLDTSPQYRLGIEP